MTITSCDGRSLYRSDTADSLRAAVIEAVSRGADLSGADLSGADLSGADLSGAQLAGAKLSGATLIETILIGADLTDADLSGTCLDPLAPLPEISDADILDRGLEIRGDQVWGWRTRWSMHVIPSVEYDPRPEPYVAPVFSASAETSCHPGIYLASRDWLRAAYPAVPVVRCYCLRSELLLANRGGKQRAKRLWVVEEE